MSQLLGVLIMIASTLLLMKYVSSLKKEMKAPANEWWPVILREIFSGASILIVLGFLIGFLLVIKPF